MTAKASRSRKGSNQATVDEWIEKLEAAMGQHRQGIFEIGDILNLAEEQLSKTAFQKVVKNSGVRSVSTANNYQRVARNPSLRDPRIFPHLPTSVGTLIDIASWSEKVLLGAIAYKILTPEVTRTRLATWAKRIMADEPPPKGPKKDGAIVAYLQVNVDTKSDEIHNFVREFNKKSHNQKFILLFKRNKFHSYTRFDFLCRWLEEFLEENRALFDELEMEAVFGPFSEWNSPFYMGEWVAKLIDPQNAEIRSAIPLSQDELAFMVEYRAAYWIDSEEPDKTAYA